MKVDRRKAVVLSGAMTLILYMILSYGCQVYPFGNHSLLVYDMAQQYVDFLSYFKSVVTSADAWNYGFVQSIGGETVSLFAYYLMSPFNLILVLFSKNILLGIYVETACKIVCIAMAMAYFIHTMMQRQGWCGMLLASVAGVSYALSSYVIVYQLNIMWLDGVMILPLVMLGLYRMLHEHRISILYAAALLYALVSNFYIGYMISIFCVLVWIYYQIRYGKKRYIGWDFLRFALHSILAAGIGAILLVPFAFSMTGTKTTFDIHSLLTLSTTHSWQQIVQKIYPNSWIATDILNGAPLIYVGIVIFILCFAYFFVRGISLRAKIATGCLLLVMYLSMYLSGADLVWHVFNAPNCYPGRYSFIICFLLIVIAIEAITYLDKRSILWIVLGGAVYILLAYVVRDEGHMLSMKWIVVLTLGYVIAISLAILLKGADARWKRNLVVILWIGMAIIALADITRNAYKLWSQLPSTDAEAYQTYEDQVKSAVEYIKEQDDGFYRIEKDFGIEAVDCNGAYLFDYYGISAFSSTTKDTLKDFMGALGYGSNYLKIYYGEGATPVADSLLGVKYVMSLTEYTQEQMDSLGYSLFQYIDGVYIYKNEEYSGLAYALDDTQVAALHELELDDSTDTFLYQNQLFAALTGTESDVLEQIANDSVQITMDNMKLTDGMVQKVDEAESGTVTYHITAQDSGYIYYRVAGDTGLSNIYVNGEQLSEYYAWDNWTMSRVYLEAGESTDITVSVDPGQCSLEELTFYYVNQEVYAKGMQALQDNQLQVSMTTSSKLSVTLEDTSSALLMVPYDVQWSSRSADVESVNGLLYITTDTENTERSMEISYKTKGLIPGAVISIICFGISGVILYRKKRVAAV